MPVKRKKISSLSTFEMLMCYICKKFVEAPATISCEHHFCHTCLLKKLELKPNAKCPACNKTIKKDSVITNSKISKIFQELKNLSQQQQESKEQESGKKPALKATKGHKRARTSQRNLITGTESVSAVLKEGVLPFRRRTSSVPQHPPIPEIALTQNDSKEKEKVTTWLKDTSTDAIPTQDHSLILLSPTVTDGSPLISVSQVKQNKIEVTTTDFKKSTTIEKDTSPVYDPYEYIASQPDSLKRSHQQQQQSKRLSLGKKSKFVKSINRNEITSRKETPEKKSVQVQEDAHEMLLFRSQSEEYMKEQEEKRLKEIESPIIIHDVAKKKKRREIIVSDKEMTDAEEKMKQQIEAVENFNLVIEAKEKIESLAGLNPSTVLSESNLSSTKNLKSHLVKMHLSQDIKSIVTSPETVAVQLQSKEINQITKASSSKTTENVSPGFSRLKKMRLDFKSPTRKVLVPLDVSSSAIRPSETIHCRDIALRKSTRNYSKPIRADKQDRQNTLELKTTKKFEISREIQNEEQTYKKKEEQKKVLENELKTMAQVEKKRQLQESCDSSYSSLGPPDLEKVSALEDFVTELEKKINETSDLDNTVSGTQISVSLIENSVPMDIDAHLPINIASTSEISNNSTPKKILKNTKINLVTEKQINTQELVISSPIKESQLLSQPSLMPDKKSTAEGSTQMSQTTVNLLEQIHSLTANDVQSRKTFSLESNTADIMTNIPIRESTQDQLQSLLGSTSSLQNEPMQTVIHMKTSKPEANVKFRKLGNIRHSLLSLPLCKFIKLGYLSPQLHGKRFTRRSLSRRSNTISRPDHNESKIIGNYCEKGVQTLRRILQTRSQQTNLQVVCSIPTQTNQPTLTAKSVQTSQTILTSTVVQTSPVSTSVSHATQWSPQCVALKNTTQIYPQRTVGNNIIFTNGSNSQDTVIIPKSSVNSLPILIDSEEQTGLNCKKMLQHVPSHLSTKSPNCLPVEVDDDDIGDEDEMTVIEKSQEANTTLLNTTLSIDCKDVININPEMEKLENKESECFTIDSSDILQASISQPIKCLVEQNNNSASSGDSINNILVNTSSTSAVTSPNQNNGDENCNKNKNISIKCKKRQIVFSDSDSDFEISPANKTTSFTAPAKKLLSTRQKWYEDNSSSGSSIRAIIRDDLEYAEKYARTYSTSPELVILDLSPACSPAVLEKKIVPEETYAQDAAEIHSRDESVPCKSIIEPEKELESESDSDGFIENTPKRRREAKKPGIRTPLSSPMKLAMPISICYSGLNNDSIKQVQKFMKRFKQVQCSNNFIPATTTHVIVHHEENMRASSTRKFLLALACGRWVVSEKWISCCLQADKILPEEPYEMLSSNGIPSPKSARLSAKKLFRDFEIYCGDESRSYTAVTKKELEEIISCAGATVINQIQLQQSKTKKYRIVIIPTDEVPNDLRDCRFLVLTMDWIIDSIEQFRLASVVPHMTRTIDDLLVSEQNFPPEMMKVPEDYTLSYSTADSTNVTSNSITHDTKS